MKFLLDMHLMLLQCVLGHSSTKSIVFTFLFCINPYTFAQNFYCLALSQCCVASEIVYPDSHIFSKDEQPIITHVTMYL